MRHLRRAAPRDSPSTQLSEPHLQIRLQAKRCADEVIRPLAAEIDRSERFPGEISAAMAGLGLLGTTVAEADGGAGADALGMEELPRGYTSIADPCGLSRWSARCSGRGSEGEVSGPAAPRRAKLRVCHHPGRGRLRRRRHPHHGNAHRHGWRLDGAKQWIHNASVCDFAVILARGRQWIGSRDRDSDVRRFSDARPRGAARGGRRYRFDRRSAGLHGPPSNADPPTADPRQPFH
jgi:hypothetical protein